MADQVAGSVFTYGQIRAKNPAYEERADWWTKLGILYEGGDKLQRNVSKFLPQLVGEHPLRYQERVKSAGYINYVAQIIDHFAAAVFQQELTISPPSDAQDGATPGQAPETPDNYKEFERDTDTKNTTFVELLKCCVTSGLLRQWTWVQIDLPTKPADVPMTIAQEEAKGQLRPYAYEICAESVLDWKEDTKGLVWAIVQTVFNERDTPEADRSRQTDEFTVWRRGLNDAITWERYSISYDLKQPPKPEDPVPFVSSGTTSFKRIPLLRFELKKGLWIGNLVGHLVREHFQRRATLVSSGNRSLVAIPFVKLGPQTPEMQGAIAADIVEDQTRGDDPVAQFYKRGFTVLGHQDELGFAEPEGKAYAFTAEDLDRLKDEIFRVVRQMAASAGNSPSALGRSGLSKQEDRASETVILQSLGQALRVFAVQIFTTISEALGETVLWVAHGLDKYNSQDRGSVVDESTKIDDIGIPSPTFKKEHKTRQALALVDNLPPATQQQIRAEIQTGVDQEEELRVETHKSKLNAIKNPPPVAPPGATPPGVKPPPPKQPNA